MNGIELRRTLATVRPALPVLLMSADPLVVSRPAMLEGAVCLEKTVRDDTLVKTILSLVAAADGSLAMPAATKAL